mgnify:CR=1 FL=1
MILTDEEIADMKRDYGFGINDLNWWEAVRAVEQAVLAKIKAQGAVAWGNFKDNGEACLLSISQHPADRANWVNPKPLYAIPEDKCTSNAK